MGRFYSMQRQLARLIQIVRAGRARAAGSARAGNAGTGRRGAAEGGGTPDRVAPARASAGVHGRRRPRRHDFTLAVRVLAAFRRAAHAVEQAGGQATRAQRGHGQLDREPTAARNHKMRAEFDKAFREAREGGQGTRMSESTGTDFGSQALRAVNAMRAEVAKALIGQSAIIDQVLIALLAGGHVLIEGVPGLGKTLLVRALAKTFDGRFARIQFTPDLMPADVTGHTLYDQATREFTTRKGPVFTNLLLADEINRAPAKTQAALLEVMQEGQVTIEGTAHPLEPPFMVLATQNPIEQEGTYALPEAQLDRFLLKIRIDFPTLEDEHTMVRQVTANQVGDRLNVDGVSTLIKPSAVLALQRYLAAMTVDPRVIGLCGAHHARHAHLAGHRRGRQPARRHLAGARRARSGADRWPRFRHARRRQGSGAARPAPSHDSGAGSGDRRPGRGRDPRRAAAEGGSTEDLTIPAIRPLARRCCARSPGDAPDFLRRTTSSGADRPPRSHVRRADFDSPGSTRAPTRRP